MFRIYVSLFIAMQLFQSEASDGAPKGYEYLKEYEKIANEAGSGEEKDKKFAELVSNLLNTTLIICDPVTGVATPNDNNLNKLWLRVRKNRETDTELGTDVKEDIYNYVGVWMPKNWQFEDNKLTIERIRATFSKRSVQPTDLKFLVKQGDKLVVEGTTKTPQEYCKAISPKASGPSPTARQNPVTSQPTSSPSERLEQRQKASGAYMLNVAKMYLDKFTLTCDSVVGEPNSKYQKKIFLRITPEAKNETSVFGGALNGISIYDYTGNDDDDDPEKTEACNTRNPNPEKLSMLIQRIFSGNDTSPHLYFPPYRQFVSDLRWYFDKRLKLLVDVNGKRVVQGTNQTPQEYCRVISKTFQTRTTPMAPAAMTSGQGISAPSVPTNPGESNYKPSPSMLEEESSSSSGGSSSSSGMMWGILDVLGGPMALIDSVLQPVLADLTRNIIDVTHRTLELWTSTRKFCTYICGKGAKLQCSTETGLGLCKLRCQNKIQLPGYELRIRYGSSKTGKPWDLKQCIGYAIGNELETIEEKNEKASRTNSFAIYGVGQLDFALDQIAVITKLKKFLGKSYLDLNLPANELVKNYFEEHPEDKARLTPQKIHEALVSFAKAEIKRLDGVLKDQMAEAANVQEIKSKSSKKKGKSKSSASGDD